MEIIFDITLRGGLFKLYPETKKEKRKIRSLYKSITKKNFNNYVELEKHKGEMILTIREHDRY